MIIAKLGHKLSLAATISISSFQSTFYPIVENDFISLTRYCMMNVFAIWTLQETKRTPKIGQDYDIMNY